MSLADQLETDREERQTGTAQFMSQLTTLEHV